MNRKSLIVLAGGFGTRLRSEIKDMPKALAPVNGKPFLGYLIENWILQGIDHLIFSLHYKAEEIIAFVEQQKEGVLKDCLVDYIIENTPLGTGGAVVNVIRNLNLTHPFFLANADTWLGSGIAELSSNGELAISLMQVSNVSRYGEVSVNAEHNVIDFKEKNDQHVAGYINGGLYRLTPEIFKDWTETAFSLERDFLPGFIRKKTVKGITLNTPFIDIGIPADYKRFCKWIEGNKRESL